MDDSPNITFSELLNKARKVELEDYEIKGVTKVQTKSVVVRETSPMSKLQQQVAQLTTLVKSAQVRPKGNPYKGFQKKDKNWRNNDSSINSDARMQSKGPDTGSNGPFRPGQRSIWCYKCKGCLCLSQLNFTGAGMAKEYPPPSQESVKDLTPQNPPPQNQ